MGTRTVWRNVINQVHKGKRCWRLHTKDQPYGYLAWHTWAAKMQKTHDQVQCPDCGRWEIWVPKDPGKRHELGLDIDATGKLVICGS